MSTAPSPEVLPEGIKAEIDRFQEQVEEAVIMANVLSQELGSVHDMIKEALDQDGIQALDDVKSKLTKLSSQLGEIASYTGKAEIGIERFLSSVKSD